MNDLVSEDGHELDVNFSATAAIAESAADAAMIREMFGIEARELTSEQVHEQFLGVVRSALATMLNRQPAATFDDAKEVERIRDNVAESLRVAGFANGIRFTPPYALTIQSPTRQRHALEAAARTRAAETLAHASAAGREFAKLRGEQPNATVDQLMNQIGSAASATLLPTLLKMWAQQKPVSEIVVTSGEKLVCFSPSGENWESKTLDLMLGLGALRSVFSSSGNGKNGRRVLIGGQTGAAIVSLSDVSETTVFPMPRDCVSQLGLNAVALGESHLFATHSEFGLFVWPTDEPRSPRLYKLPNAKFATMIASDRCVLAAGDQLFFATADAVQPIAKPTAAAVVSILAAGAAAQLIFADGTVAEMNPRTSQLQTTARVGNAVSVAASIDWLGERRRVIANDRGEIEVVGEASRTRFVSSHAGWRKTVAAADLIVALSLDRTRLVLWRPWNPQAPTAELHVASLTQHRAADVALSASLT